MRTDYRVGFVVLDLGLRHEHVAALDLGVIEDDEVEHEHRDDVQPHDAHCQRIGRDAAFGKALEEARTDLQADAIDEEDETKVLNIVQHLQVARETDMTGQDAGEEHEGDTQGDAEDFVTAEEYAHGDDQRVQQHDVCDGVGVGEKINKPIHILS